MQGDLSWSLEYGRRYSSLKDLDICIGICQGAWNKACNVYDVVETFAQGSVRDFSLR